MGARKDTRHAHARQGKQRRERGLGFKKGTLALGTSTRGTVGTRGASTGASGAD